MRDYLVLLYGFVSRDFTMIRRYPLNFVGTLLSFLLVFLLIFWAGQAVAPVAIGNTIGAIIVGYFLFATVQSTFFALSGFINSEAQYGTLEQLYISPFSFTTVMLAAVVASIVLSLGMGVVNLAVVLLVTSQSLTIDLVTISPILLLTLCHAIGLSFLFAGIALLYKRIRSLFSIVQFVFLGLISLALTDMSWPKLLPVGQGAAMLHEAMTNGTRLWEFTIADNLLLAGTAVVYLTIGYLAFHVAQHRARQQGLLNDY